MAAAVDIGDLLDRLRRVDDPREERGVRHSLVDVLFIPPYARRVVLTHLA